MSRLYVTPTRDRFIVQEICQDVPVVNCPPVFPDRDSALVFLAWMESYREGCWMFPPVDAQMEIAAGIIDFLQRLAPYNLGPVLTAEELRDAFLDSDAGKAAVRRAIA